MSTRSICLTQSNVPHRHSRVIRHQGVLARTCLAPSETVTAEWLRLHPNTAGPDEPGPGLLRAPHQGWDLLSQQMLKRPPGQSPQVICLSLSTCPLSQAVSHVLLRHQDYVLIISQNNPHDARGQGRQSTRASQAHS